MSTLNELKTSGDLVLNEVDPRYTRAGVALTNPAAGPDPVSVPDVVGQPVKLNGSDWEFVLAADIANAIGVVYSGPPVVGLAASADTAKLYTILIDGPSLVKSSGLAADDIAGSAITQATFQTALEAVNIKTIDVPAEQSTQTA